MGHGRSMRRALERGRKIAVARDKAIENEQKAKQKEVMVIWQPSVGTQPILNGAVVFPLGDAIRLVGGSTERLIVASNIMGEMLRMSPSPQEAARAALDHADVLIAMELSDRSQQAVNPSDPPIKHEANGKTLQPDVVDESAGPVVNGEPVEAIASPAYPEGDPASGDGWRN